MAARYDESRMYPVSAQYIIDGIHSPGFQRALGFHLSRGDHCVLTYTFKHDVSFTSWGEDITVRLYPVGGEQTRVDLSSECSLPTQIVDWGKNKQNVHAVFSYLEHNVVPFAQKHQSNCAVCSRCGAALTSGAMFCTVCGERVQSQGQTFCPGCGAALNPGAGFCGYCGTKL